jgi:hypothetical protein
MLPVSAWPPGPPGAYLSPFGQPRQVKICGNGFVIPKGAWIVATGSNRVVMFYPPVFNVNPARTPGTGLLPGSMPQTCPPPCGCPPSGPPPFQKFNDTIPIRPPGRRPPNWFGWKFVPAPSSTLVPSGASGLVIADGQNVVITGSGCATITQAYSV